MAPFFQRLKPTPQKAQDNEFRTNVLLLDISGSMDWDDGQGRRIALLRKAVDLLGELHGINMVGFSDWAFEIDTAANIPEPMSGTDMAVAFRYCRKYGTNVVLVTDGVPNSETDALREAQGMKFDIVYVGPEPIPPFLKRLSSVSGGTLQIGQLKDPLRLSKSLSGLLEHKPASVNL